MAADSVISVASVTFVVGVISMAVDPAAGISSTAEADPVVVASTAAPRAEAVIADRASTFRLCTNGWRLRQPFFSPISDLQKAVQQKVHKSKSTSILLGCCS